MESETIDDIRDLYIISVISPIINDDDEFVNEVGSLGGIESSGF